MSTNVSAPASALQTTVVDYTAAINTMQQLAQAINQSQIPDLSGFQTIDPTDYDKFVQSFSTMKTNAVTWLTQVQPDLQSLIGALSNSSALVTLELGNALSAAQVLQNNAGDSNALTTFNGALTSVANNLANLQTFVSSTATLVANNQSIITGSNADLASISTEIGNMLTTAGTSINNINSNISSLNSQISSLNSQIETLHVVEYGEGVLMLVGFALALSGNPSGIFMFFGGMVSISLEQAQLDVDQQMLPSLQSMVGTLQQELTTDTAAYAAAQTASAVTSALTTQLNQLIGAGTPMQQIESFVGESLSDLQQVFADVQQAQTDEGNWSEVIADIQNAQAEWQQIQQLVGKAVNYTVAFTPANVKVISATSSAAAA